MKFYLPLLLLAPAVLGKRRHTCITRPKSSTAAALPPVPTADVPVVSSVAPVVSATAAPQLGEEPVVEEPVVEEPKTTLVKSTSKAAVKPSATKPSTSKPTDSGSGGGNAVLDSTPVTGSSTFYGGNLAGGNCMFTTYTLPKGIYGTAFSGQPWDDAANCGACIEITGPSGTPIVAMIVDQCPECTKGHLDLFPDAFTAVGGTDGIVDTSYKFVECGISSPITLKNKSGTSAHWFSMQVINANVPVKSLEVSINSGKTWTQTTRKAYNFFENPSGFGTESVDVRVTSTTGKTIVVKNVGIAADSEHDGGSNF